MKGINDSLTGDSKTKDQDVEEARARASQGISNKATLEGKLKQMEKLKLDAKASVSSYRVVAEERRKRLDELDRLNHL